MKLLLFLALLTPPTQQTVYVDPNYNCAMKGTCIATETPSQIYPNYNCGGTCITTGQQVFQSYTIEIPQQPPLAQQTYAQLQAEYDADMKMYWESDHSKDESALMAEIHDLNVELDKRDRAIIQANTEAIESGFAEVRHERAVKARIQAWHQFVNECQHRSWKHGYRHPSWCKVVK